MTLAEKIIAYHKQLTCNSALPEGFSIINPFQNAPDALKSMTQFYRKFYNDHRTRRLILGINPGRFGAGLTGVPFTDSKHLIEDCKIPFSGPSSHEPSAAFVYLLIEIFGGVSAFYQAIYINSVFPLALIRKNKKGNSVNCNYYDDQELIKRLWPSMKTELQKQVSMGLRTDKAFIFGKRNAHFIEKLNKELNLFDQLVVFEHPRYIQQYKYHERHEFAQRFAKELKT